MNRLLLLLDRDGVINEPPKTKKRYILQKRDLILRSRVIKEIARIQKYADVAIVTNQQCVGKGLLSRKKLDELHEKINRSIQSEGGKTLTFFVCVHLKEDMCACRKPNPGLLYEAMSKFGLTEKESCLFIGDNITDEEAANAAGIPFIRVWDEDSTTRALQEM